VTTPATAARVHLAQGGVFTPATSQDVTASREWQTISVVRTAPASGIIRIVLEDVSGAGTEFDAVLLEAGTSPGLFRLNTADAGGTYLYTVTRNLDGSGANDWYAGDAIFNTGQAGSGFIDLYSLRGVKSANQAGPAIALNVRNSTSYNDWTEHAALGNLKGLYDYGTDVYGVAVGRYAPDKSWIGADASNGVRIMQGSVAKGRWFNDGTITIGEQAASQANVRITTNRLALRVNTAEYIVLDSTVPSVRVNDPGGGSFVQLSGGDIQLWGNGTQRIGLKANGDIVQGTNVAIAAGTLLLVKGAAGAAGEAGETLAAGDILIGRNGVNQANMRYSQALGQLQFRGGTFVQAYVDTDGSIVAGGGDLRLSAAGMTLTQGNTDTKRIRWLNGANTIASITGQVAGGGFLAFSATSANTGGVVAAHQFTATATGQSVALTVRAQNSEGFASGLRLSFSGTDVLALNNDNQGLGVRHGVSAFYTSQAGEGIMRAKEYRWQQSNGLIDEGATLIRAASLDWVRLADPAEWWSQGVYIPSALRVDRHLFVGVTQQPASFTTGPDGQIRAGHSVMVTNNSSDPNYPTGFAASAGGIFEAYRSTATTYVQSSGFGNTSCILFNCYLAAQTALPSAANQTAYTVAAGASSQRAGGIFFSSSGGVMRFMVSPVSTGVNQAVNWNADGGTGPEVMNLSRYSGYLHASAWFYESDERSKDEIAYPAEDAHTLRDIRRRLRRLRPAQARYRGDPRGRRTVSFIAQQLKEVFPEMVVTGEDGYHAVATTELIPYLVADNAAQEQEITDLRRRIDRLEMMVDQLRPPAA